MSRSDTFWSACSNFHSSSMYETSSRGCRKCRLVRLWMDASVDFRFLLREFRQLGSPNSLLSRGNINWSKIGCSGWVKCSNAKNSKLLFCRIQARGVTSENSRWGCAARFRKSWPNYRPKNVIFYIRFQTWPLRNYVITKIGATTTTTLYSHFHYRVCQTY